MTATRYLGLNKDSLLKTVFFLVHLPFFSVNVERRKHNFQKQIFLGKISLSSINWFGSLLWMTNLYYCHRWLLWMTISDACLRWLFWMILSDYDARWLYRMTILDEYCRCLVCMSLQTRMEDTMAYLKKRLNGN